MLGNKWLLFLAVPSLPLAVYLIRRIGVQTEAIDRRLEEARAEEMVSPRDPHQAFRDLWDANVPKSKEK